MSSRSSLVYALITLIAASLAGCGSSDGKLAVEGTASWNGQPIDEGYVGISPINGPGQVEGADIVQGKFSVRTTEGEKRVSVVARRKIGEIPPTDRMPQPEPILFQYLPPEFNEASQQKIAVSSSNPTISLDLKGTELSQAAEAASDLARRTAQRVGGR